MQIHRKISSARTVNRFGKCDNAKLTYIVSECGPGDHTAAVMELVKQTAPLHLADSSRKKIVLVNVVNDTYEVDVHYELPTSNDERAAGDRRWTLEVRSVNTHISDARELVKSVSVNGFAAPDPGTAIGWDGVLDGESEISGASVKMPEIYEKCVATYLSSKVNSSLKRKIANAVGKLNSSSFHGWDGGEVLLLNVDQSEAYYNNAGDLLVDITYTFGIRPNGSRYSGGVKVSNCGGWSVLWNIMQRDPDGSSAVVCGVYESRVYDKTSFSQLGI